MDVELYVYDLSKGIARQMSRQFLGIQIDAVYHTAIVFGGVEYFFGGGVQTSYPGGTHHGKPMEVVALGRTEVDLPVILEYLESLKGIYTMESYDLFLHNCNNFSNDFAIFLVGKGIPEHITSLPQTVLETPFGQMLKPQLDQAMRGITQAPVPPSNVPAQNGYTSSAQTNGRSTKQHEITGSVYKPTRLAQLEELLASAKNSCAVIFFTSATCPPCKLVYPAYDELAASAGTKAVLIKVDLNDAYEIGAKYQVRVTPTFWTFLKGEKENEWQGANESQLRGNVNLLLQMAHPAHPHTHLRLPTLSRPRNVPVTYSKIPPIEKLVAKVGPPACDEKPFKDVQEFIKHRHTSGARDAPLPALPEIGKFVIRMLDTLPLDKLFPIVDLFRLMLVDIRVSGYFAQDRTQTVLQILRKVTSFQESECPYQLRIVTLHMACNLFTSPLFPPRIVSDSTSLVVITQLITSSLLDSSHPPVRVVAASLAYNLAAFSHDSILVDDGPDVSSPLSEVTQVELMASLLEAISKETESKDGMRGLLLAAGLLKYKAPQQGELVDLCQALDAKGTIKNIKKRFEGKDIEELRGEVELVM